MGDLLLEYYLENGKRVDNGDLTKHRKLTFKHLQSGTSLVVQWLRLHAADAGGPGSIPGPGTGPHMLQQQHQKASASEKPKSKTERAAELEVSVTSNGVWIKTKISCKSV